MDNPTEDLSLPADWIADLTASKAEIERGEAVPMRSAVDRMQAAIDRIESRDADRREA